jgi:hypothetical protein
MQTLILFYFIIEDHDTLFVMSEGVHFMGIGVLAYKLLKKRNCGGTYSTSNKQSHTLNSPNTTYSKKLKTFHLPFLTTALCNIF